MEFRKWIFHKPSAAGLCSCGAQLVGFGAKKEKLQNPILVFLFSTQKDFLKSSKETKNAFLGLFVAKLFQKFELRLKV